jgi:hypothetical protein
MQDVPVRCHTCGHSYGDHPSRAGGCAAAADPGPPGTGACGCDGFRWVPADGPSVGSYLDAPLSPRP